MQEKEYVAHDSSSVFRRGKELSAHNFLGFILVTSREREVDLSLPLICHAVAAHRDWKQPDPCTLLAAEIPSCNKVGLGVREISIAGRGAGNVALYYESVGPARPRPAHFIDLPVIPT